MTAEQHTAWRRWITGALIVGGAVSIWTPWNDRPGTTPTTTTTTGGTTTTVAPGSETFVLASTIGPQDDIDCDDSPYSGYTVVAAGSTLSTVLEAGGTVGEKFCFRAGRHTIDEPIQLDDDMELYGEKGAILDGGLRPTFSSSSGLWVATGLTLTGTPTNASTRCSGVASGTPATGWPTEPSCTEMWDVWWNGTWVDKEDCTGDPPTGCGLGAGEAYVDEAAGKVWLGFDPTGGDLVVSRGLDTGITDRAVWNNGHNTGTDAGDVIIDNLTIEHVGTKDQHGAIDVRGGNWTIRNVEVRRTHGVGIQAYGGTTEDSIAHHIGQLNVSAQTGGTTTDTVFRRNEMHSSNLAHYWAGWEAGASKFIGTTGFLVENNYSHHVPQAGLWFDINNRANAGWSGADADRNRVLDNWISDTGAYVDDTTEWPLTGSVGVGRGIFYEISCEALIAGNTIVNAGIDAAGNPLTREPNINSAIHISSSWDVIVRDNVIDHAGNAITLGDQGRDDQDGYCHIPGDNDAGDDYHPVADVDVHDNTIKLYSASSKIGGKNDAGTDQFATNYPCGGSTNCDGDGLDEMFEPGRNNDFHDNDYWLTDLTSPASCASGTAAGCWWEWADNYRNWSTWTGTYGQDSGSTRTATTTANKPCSLRTPDLFTPTRVQYTPPNGTSYDVWVRVDAPDIYADKLWFVPPTGCPTVLEAASTAEVWVQAANATTYTAGQSFTFDRYDNDVAITRVRVIPDSAACTPTGDGTNCATGTNLSGTEL